MRNIFELTYDSSGNVGVQCKECRAGIGRGTKPEYKTVLIAWRSPYATAEHNDWLEKQLKKLYTRYYMKVIIENMGSFF